MDKEDEDETQFLLDHSESSEDGQQTGLGIKALSESTKKLLKRLGHRFEGDTVEDDLELPEELKIFYSSRTHSQLTQFVNELRRIKPPPLLSPLGVVLEEGVKHLSLGSRKNLCINERVKNLGSLTAINERCLELQQPGILALLLFF